MTKYSFRHVTKHSPDSCGMLLRAAYENQHHRGIEIKPGWKHCARVVIGSIKGTKLILVSGRIAVDSRVAFLCADILDHEDGSVIVGVFRASTSSRVIVWFSRVFISVLLLVPLALLSLGKLRDPQALPGFGLSAAALIIIGIYITLMLGLPKLLNIKMEDVQLVHDFIERATTSSKSEAEQDEAQQPLSAALFK
jgi:hypothetical protein